MRITSLKINNLRAVERLEVDDLNDFVVIAGPNGCGKTTVLDAVRLLKSIYVKDEWKRWFNEFGINIDRPTNFHNIFRDRKKPVYLYASFLLTEGEVEFLRSHADHIARAIVLNEYREGNPVAVTGDPPLEPKKLRAGVQAIEREWQALSQEIRDGLGRSPDFIAELRLTPAKEIILSPSPVAAAAFSCFRPDVLGEIEFHSSRRSYSRESVNSIRLQIGDRSEERRNRFLYDLENKYKNIKTQLGEEYVASILRRKNPNEAPLQKSIKSLFKTFFPGKEFLGISTGGDNSLRFPVRLDSGEVHDIDELSSGEKEIVYGYLVLRTGTPKHSIILVDEPELHLNPALVHALPGFYKVNIADALDAQVWIVTHSDAILRQAVRDPSMAVYHMARVSGSDLQQANRIQTQDAVEAAVIDLIGDLAAYRPHAKIILIEGHKETRFDVDVIRRLFPEIAERANFIPVGNRRMTTGVRVRLLEVLEETGLTGRAVSISDYDSGVIQESERDRHYFWPVYEIENFLLDPKILREAVKIFIRNDPFRDDNEVIQSLREIAAGLVEKLAIAEIQYRLDEEFVTSINIGSGGENAEQNLQVSAKTSQARISGINLSEDRIRELVREASDRFTRYLSSTEFLKRFPGDRLIRAFSGKFRINAEHFKNACLDQAQRQNYRPPEMERILKQAVIPVDPSPSARAGTLAGAPRSAGPRSGGCGPRG